MSALHHNLPTLEELQFRQVVQCTTCLNTGHSTICHSKAHSVEQCQYNLLNKATTFVRQIHLENSYQDNCNRLNNTYQEDDRYDNRNYSGRRPNNDWNDYRQNDSYDSTRDEDRQHDYRRDDHHNRDQDFSPPRDNGRQQYKHGRYQNKQI